MNSRQLRRVRHRHRMQAVRAKRMAKKMQGILRHRYLPAAMSHLRAQAETVSILRRYLDSQSAQRHGFNHSAIPQ